jgi:hypothetical protein
MFAGPVSGGDVAIAAGIAHHDADGSVVFDPPAEPATGPDVPPIQRTEDAATPVTQAPSPVPSVVHPGAAAPGNAGAEADLEELARRLFDPLTARIKAELWLDRERAGLITDSGR